MDGSRVSLLYQRPAGRLAELTAQIAAAGASVNQVVHDRAFASSDVSAVNVLCTVETRDRRAPCRFARPPASQRRQDVRCQAGCE
jgi:hypothetical protein